jgi:AcrR family transcriptional regulator
MSSRRASRRSSAETREHVLATAQELFYWHGVRAVGVDTVAAEAGVAPTTLYRLFASKDDLVAAYVERADRHYREWFEQATRKDGRSARERILALFDALADQVRPDFCRGCLFLMALTEFPDSDLPTHRHAVAMKKWVRARIGALTRELASTSSVDDPAALADQLSLIMEGVYASVQSLGAAGPARRARSLVETLLPGEKRRRR